MRRLVALFVLALIGATLYGLSGMSSGLIVNHETLSSHDFLSEANAIENNLTLQCYIYALDPTSYAKGAGVSMKAAGVGTWADLRVEGLAINQYVTKHFKYHPDAAQLAAAKVSLESEMTQQASERSLTCPGTSATAVAEMPAEMRTAEVEAQATSIYLVGRVKNSIPLTTASMENYYAAHVTDYDTLCVSVAVVSPANATAFEEAEESGLSVAALAKKYSEDPSASKGGALGCYAPTSKYYAGVRSDVESLTLNTYSKPSTIQLSTGDADLFVAVTRRTTTPFAQAETAVLADLQSLNAATAGALKDTLLARAAIHVDPAFGVWGVSSAGPGVVAPTVPPASDVTSTKVLTSASITYK